jgi:cardiolipin synthase
VARIDESIRIVTPYFLPDDALKEALIVARMRGVQVDVVMPHTNNLRYVAWAAMGEMDPLLIHDVHLWFEEGPFDHSKVTVVDDAWVIFGSPNWDPRSLRLNFEFSLECYNRPFAREISEYVDARIASARRWTLEDHQNRGFLSRVRDGIFRLGAPYL